MAVAKLINQRFLQVFLELLNSYEFEKISVSMICKKTGMARQTFYYHFKDKYDLAYWPLKRRIEIEKSEYLAKNESWETALEHVFRYLSDSKSYFLKLMHGDSRGSFQIYFVDQVVSAYEDVLSEAVEDAAVDDLTRFAILSVAHGGVGVLLDWIQGDIEYSPQEMAQMMMRCLPNVLTEYFE